MPRQFDVFTNPLRDKSVYPLVVVLQSPFAELAKTRIVAPAVPLAPGARISGLLTPRFGLGGQEYALQIFQLTSLKATDLKRCVGNISSIRDEITRALDHLFHDNS